ncbi:MAG: DUF4440 domain-containing protein [Granulosicoccus sp.]
MSSLQLMLNIEKQHLDETVRSSAEQLGALLCDDFREFGKSGRIFDKAEILMSVTNSIAVADYDIQNYQIVQLGDGHILATYKLLERQGELLRWTLRSTVWKLVDTKWRMLFHQGTKQAE